LHLSYGIHKLEGMEKRRAHYDLGQVKAVVMYRGIDSFTSTALLGLFSMGLSEADGVSIVLGLRRDMLFKSMTTHADSRVWQDVYHAPCPNGKTAYVKVTLQDGAVVIQFKEL
jgi:motility quorum-sensing regulator/GCU-specific mRNA interferase toxin